MDVQVDRLFETLADPRRREIVQLLGQRPHRAGELAKSDRNVRARHEPAPAYAPRGRPRHRRTGAQDARVRVFRLRPESLTAVQAWLDQVQAHWNEQLQSFKRHADSKESRS